ncbi:hypothetical protein [Brevundimonas sp.]|nr:hypothetical protein [Brevundimonas sp.]MDZ4363860.1 hypothetical protein [Brevundimonas sp.]
MTQITLSKVTAPAAEGRLTWTAPTIDLAPAADAEAGPSGVTDGPSTS